MLLPTPTELKIELPLKSELNHNIHKFRRTIHNHITGKEKKLVVVTGPCSIHDPHSALEYAHLLKDLSKKVEKHCLLVMRVYLEKPRTLAGWKGLLYDPHLDGSNDIQTGLYLSRKLLISLSELGLPIATEFLDPLASLYFEDLISWGFVGARTCSSPTHRQLASSLSLPIGFKNSTDGNLDNAINGVIASRSSHASISIDENGKLFGKQSTGNFSTHIVLRGSAEAPNYDPLSIQEALHKLQQARLTSRLLIDCSHGNCGKKFENQKIVFHSVLEQILSGNEHIMGMMLESHLEEGNQILSEDVSSVKSSVSVTDPCIDWSSTKELILSAVGALSSESSSLAG